MNEGKRSDWTTQLRQTRGTQWNVLWKDKGKSVTFEHGCDNGGGTGGGGRRRRGRRRRRHCKTPPLPSDPDVMSEVPTLLLCLRGPLKVCTAYRDTQGKPP